MPRSRVILGAPLALRAVAINLILITPYNYRQSLTKPSSPPRTPPRSHPTYEYRIGVDQNFDAMLIKYFAPLPVTAIMLLTDDKSPYPHGQGDRVGY